LGWVWSGRVQSFSLLSGSGRVQCVGHLCHCVGMDDAECRTIIFTQSPSDANVINKYAQRPVDRTVAIGLVGSDFLTLWWVGWVGFIAVGSGRVKSVTMSNYGSA